MTGWMERFLVSLPTSSKVRLWSGIVLLVYVVGHFLNHALGLISRDIMEAGGEIFREFWRFAPVSILLYGALLAHVVSALSRFIQRRSLALTPGEWVQLVLGLAIPFLLLTHVMGTRYGHEVYELNDSYTYVLLSTFVFSPTSGILNTLGLLAAWIHACVGVHQWLHLKTWYTHVHSWLLSIGVALPLFALGGYLSAGRSVIPLATDGEFMGAYYERLNVVDDQVFAMLLRDIDRGYYVAVVILLAVLVLHILRRVITSRRNSIKVEYLDGPTIQQGRGPTLLEMSKLAGVPHASVCGGKGRCSTCRVRIVKTQHPLEPPSESELKVLQRFGAPEDVRLACQTRPVSDLSVVRLLPSDATMATAANLHPWSTGSEKEIAVMFADLRDFTKTSEARLPFDVVYLINQFSQAMGQTVEHHGGRIDKFLGDGFMALFGLDVGPDRSAAQALAAARDMLSELTKLNERLAGDLDEPLRMGIGIHSGPVVLGDMGYGDARRLTAIGDTVNTASRLEAATKENGCAMCVSAHTVKLAGLHPDKDLAKRVSVRGKAAKVVIFAVDDPEELKSLEAAGAAGQTDEDGEYVRR